MNLHQLHHIQFGTKETIVAAALSSAEKLVMLLSSGRVLSYNITKRTFYYLFSIPIANGHPQIQYADGGFDIKAPCSIYTMEENVVVVNDYKTHGYLFTSKKQKVHLWRKNNYAEHSRYSILFYKHDDIPFLIYATNLNRVDILNIETLQKVTAAKSLIEENAEKDLLNFMKIYGEKISSPWPHEYTYYYGGLQLSPDKKKFLTLGWSWGSSDTYTIYDIEDFITNPRIKHKLLSSWEHINRGACWIDDNTVAVIYDPVLEGDIKGTVTTNTEIKFYNVSLDEPEIIKRLPLPGFNSSNSKLYYYNYQKILIALSGEKELWVSNTEGEILLKEKSFNPEQFNAEIGCFLTISNKSTITIHSIS